MDSQIQTLQQNLESIAQRSDAEGIESCETSGNAASDHFRGVTKMIELGKGGQRPVDDFMLTRYACYLIAQNGDPRKLEIAFAQSYFAVQTRRQELIEDRMRLQARMEARERLKESEKALSQDMKDKYGIVKTRPLADFLPTLTIAAKNLATEMTNHNVQQANLQGENSITHEHVQNNVSVRNMLGQRGIQPENLAAEEDLKKLERRVKTEEKKLAKTTKTLPESEPSQDE